MKNYLPILLVTISVFLLRNNTYSQISEILQRTSQPTSNYYQIKTDAESYLQTLSLSDSSTFKEYKTFSRWITFWEHRINNGTLSGKGKFLNSAKAYNGIINGTVYTYGSTKNTTWEYVGPNEEMRDYYDSAFQNSGLVSAICPSPYFNGTTNKSILVGSNTGGLFQNTAVNYNWKYSNTGMLLPGIGIIDIVIRSDSATPVTYIATGKDRYNLQTYGGGIFKGNSNSWDTLSSFPNHKFGICRKILLDTLGSCFYIYAAVDDVVFRSDDDGVSWTQIFQIPNANNRMVTDMSFKPDNPSVLYISTNGSKVGGTYNNSQLWYTTNAKTAFGLSQWNHIAFNSKYSPNMRIDVSMAKPNSIWVLTKELDLTDTTKYTYVAKISNFGQSIDTLIYTTNGGVNSIDKYKMELAVSDLYPDTFFIGGLEFCTVIYNSSGATQYFHTRSSYYMHDDIRFLDNFVDRNGNEHIFVGNDGGVSYSNDYGMTFESWNKKGLKIRQFYGLGGIESDPSIYAAGSIDNGLAYNYNGEEKGQYGDFYDVVINRNSKYCYSVFAWKINGNFISSPAIIDREINDIKWINNPLLYPQLNNASTEGSLYDMPIEADPNNTNIIYYGYKNIYKLIDNGNNNYSFEKAFDILSLDSNLSNCKSIKFAPSNPNIIYIAYAEAVWYKETKKNKLWKSMDGGATWTNLTNNILNFVNSHNITDIAISSNDPNKIWVSMGDFSSAQTQEGIKRVCYSEDGGLTWRDYSFGLPGFPVNRIKYVKGSNKDELFVATDIGVYYCNNIDTVWKRMGSANQMPYFLCTDLEINYQAQQLMVSTYGNGLWKTNIDIACGNSNTSTIINSNKTWSQETSFSGNITINSGKVLTINGDFVYMDENSVITIKPSGKLIIDGAKLTSRCGMWNGILVQGDDNYDQSDESKQGVLVMKNGATIENAKVGVYVGEYFVPNHLSSVDNNLSNGIIKISNSNFLNNQRDIVVRPNALNLIGSGSTSFRKNSIINTKFTNDGNMLTDPILNKGKIGNIRLNGVKWINLSGNTFENKDNTLAVANSGIGIDAINSGFTVEAGGTTTPSNHTLPNKFINLYQGIRVVNGINTSETVKINYNKFTNTYRAIFLSGTYDAEVLKNDIKASNMAYYQSGEPDPSVPYGIYINGGKGFKVEENKIWRAFSSSPAPVFNGSRGILVNNLGGVNNEIYKNITENLFISNQAQAYNSGSGVNAALGLKYLCNKSQTSANSYDFQTFGNWYVTYNGNFSWSLHQSGIAEFQQQSIIKPDGTPGNAPAGNQFSSDHLTNETTVFDFDNGGGARIRYGWGDLTNTGEKWKPTEIDGVNVIPKPISQEIDVCPSKINSGGNGDNPTDMYAKLSDAYIAYNSSRILLDIWRDGGNTNLDEEVETTQPWDVYVEFNSLLAKSPYLSEDVLFKVVDNPAFTSLMIKLLMIANPHAKDNPRLMEAIKKRIPVMPKAYINDIRNKPDVTSQLKLLEGNVAADYHLITNIGENIKRMYRNDYTNAWVKDSLINFVGRQADLYDKYELATIYLSYGQYDEMNGTIENIYSSFKMNDEMTSELNTFKNTLDIAKLMQEKNLYENSLKKADVSALKSIVKEEKPIITPLALSLLKRNNPNYEYNEPIFNVERRSTRKTNIQTIANTETYNSTEYKLYPNPTNNYTTLSYNCRYSDMTYSIIDNTGRELIVNQLPTIEDVSSNEVLIDLSKLSNGVYQILIKTKGNLIWTEKLIVSE